MTDDEALFEYLLRLGDSPLILAQRLGAWVGKGPILEEDIALANVGLDLLGQARLWLAYAGEVEARFTRQRPLRGRARVPPRRQRFPQPAPGRATERQFRRHDGAPVPVRFMAPPRAASPVALHRSAHRGDRREEREGSRISRRALGRLGDPPGRRHRRVARENAGGDRRVVAVYRRNVRARCRRARR